MCVWNSTMHIAGNFTAKLYGRRSSDRYDTGYAAGSESSHLRNVLFTGQSGGGSSDSGSPWSADAAALYDGSGGNLDRIQSESPGRRGSLSDR